MFCKNCGQLVDDAANVCPSCGTAVGAEEATTQESVVQEAPVQEAPAQETPVQPAAAPQSAPSVSNITDNETVKKLLSNKKLVIGALAGIAVICIILVVIVGTVLFGENKKTPLEDMKKIANKQPTDVDALVEGVAPSFMSDAYLDAMKIIKSNKEYKDIVEEFYEDSEADLEDYWEESNDFMEDELGKNVKYSYEIVDEEEIEKDDLETLSELYKEVAEFKEVAVEYVEVAAEYTELEEKEVKKLVKVVETLFGEFEDMKISKGYIYEVKVTAKGKDDSENEKYDVVVVKVNGDWTIDPIMTAAIQNDMDVDDVEDYFDEYLSDSISETVDGLEDSVDSFEEGLEELDEDLIELLFDQASLDL